MQLPNNRKLQEKNKQNIVTDPQINLSINWKVDKLIKPERELVLDLLESDSLNIYDCVFIINYIENNKNIVLHNDKLKKSVFNLENFRGANKKIFISNLKIVIQEFWNISLRKLSGLIYILHTEKPWEFIKKISYLKSVWLSSIKEISNFKFELWLVKTNELLERLNILKQLGFDKINDLIELKDLLFSANIDNLRFINNETDIRKKSDLLKIKNILIHWKTDNLRIITKDLKINNIDDILNLDEVIRKANSDNLIILLKIFNKENSKDLRLLPNILKYINPKDLSEESVLNLIKEIVINKKKLKVDLSKIRNNEIIKNNWLIVVWVCDKCEELHISTFFEKNISCWLVFLNWVLIWHVKNKNIESFISYVDYNPLKKWWIYTLKNWNKLDVWINNFDEIEVRFLRNSDLNEAEMDIWIKYMQYKYKKIQK